MIKNVLENVGFFLKVKFICLQVHPHVFMQTVWVMGELSRGWEGIYE
jgi:hypothetical protein